VVSCVGRLKATPGNGTIGSKPGLNGRKSLAIEISGSASGNSIHQYWWRRPMIEPDR